MTLWITFWTIVILVILCNPFAWIAIWFVVAVIWALIQDSWTWIKRNLM